MNKIYKSSTIMFFGKFRGEYLMYGRNQIKHLRYCLFARGYSVEEIADRMDKLATKGYLLPSEVSQGEDFDEHYWILEKALPKELRGRGNNWEAIKEYLHIEEK